MVDDIPKPGGCPTLFSYEASLAARTSHYSPNEHTGGEAQKEDGGLDKD